MYPSFLHYPPSTKLNKTQDISRSCLPCEAPV
uniref:Uncharacterized protein n=1 Tax=Anguilla anguilla TaxID=7936 RepID=A0A0E9RKI8_ANGAN